MKRIWNWLFDGSVRSEKTRSHLPQRTGAFLKEKSIKKEEGISKGAEGVWIFGFAKRNPLIFSLGIIQVILSLCLLATAIVIVSR